jgi:NADPH:quinone reductase-like Zn-dependent oxidoreductase
MTVVAVETVTGTTEGTTMRAVTRRVFGPPEVLELREVARPVPADDELLVRVRAASVNPLDWHFMTATPYLARIATGLRKPKSDLLGVDFAGTVEAVGGSVQGFEPGDEVFGGRDGALAEYVCVKAERAVAHKPAGVTFEEAASVPIAGITALQALRDKGQLRPGQRVLINGASGGVGTFAVQIAKALGAEVTGVCSTRNVDQARSLGADHVIDYTARDFTEGPERYDLMIDIAGGRSWSDCKRVLEPDARLVIVGGPKTNRWVGSLGQAVKMRLAARRDSRTVAAPFLASLNKDDLVALRELLESGAVKPVIQERYPLSETPEALRRIGEGHARGKLVITV